MSSSPNLIPGSERLAPRASPVGEVDPSERAEVSVYLKRLEPPPTGGAQSRASMRDARKVAVAPQIEKISTFAQNHQLEVTQVDPGRRLVKLAGRMEDLQRAFGAQLRRYERVDGSSFRARTGPLSAPAEVVDVVEAVLGLDQRPVATPKSIRLTTPRADAGNLPSAIIRHYGFPRTAQSGGGECIAIIELGGGVSTADTKAAFKAMKLRPPKVTGVAVSGGKNQPGKDPNADAEVALDVQVTGAAAPGAAIAVYFAPNTDQGFVDAISQAVHDHTHKPSVMSISWGSAESGWTQQAITAMNSAFQDAAAVGVTVFAASGDGLATDGVSDGKAHVDFPASSEWVVGCGGTRLGSSSAAESVWNSNGGGTGGGISTLFPVPAYQQAVKLPSSANAGFKAGRGVPDVAGDADPDTGYRVVVDGQEQVIGGTSAVAPLWAGLFALINEQVGRPVGRPHARLYAHPEAFTDVRTGDNRVGGLGYGASRGWDACTGLGAPKGEAIAALFQAQSEVDRGGRGVSG